RGGPGHGDAADRRGEGRELHARGHHREEDRGDREPEAREADGGRGAGHGPGRRGGRQADGAARRPFAGAGPPRGLVLFGPPSAEPFLREGFYTEGGGASADRFLWAKSEAELALTWTSPAPRAAVVDLRPYEGVKGQRGEGGLTG